MIETWFNQDTQKAVKVQYLDGNVFSQDNNGNKVGVNLFTNGSPDDVVGTISANVIRADGATLAVSGSSSGNQAWVVLPQSAYAVPGVLSIVIKASSSGDVTTLCAVVANVYQSSTDSTVDPGTIIPSISDLIAAINAAVASIPADYSSLWESLAPAFSSNNEYVSGNYCTYNGNLYKFIKDHSGSWSASDVTAVNLGSEFSSFREEMHLPVDISAGLWSSDTGGIKHSDGTIYASSNLRYTDYIDISGIDFLVYSQFQSTGQSAPVTGLAFYNSSKTYLSGVPGLFGASERTYATSSVAVPSGAAYVRFSFWVESLGVGDPFMYDEANYQKSVIYMYDALSNILKPVNMFAVPGTVYNKCVNSSGNVTTGGTSLEIANNNYSTLTLVGNGVNISNVSFLTASISGVSSGDPVSLCDGEPARHAVEANASATFIVPPDCVYISLMDTYDHADRRPAAAYLICKPNVIVETVKAVGNQSDSPVRACIIGASIESGTTHETASSPSANDPDRAYLTVALRNNGILVTNLSHGGMGLVNPASNDKYDGTNYYTFKYIVDNTDFSDFECVYITLGGNDWSHNQPLGTPSSTGTDTACGMLKYGLNKIFTSNQKIKVFMVLPKLHKKSGYGDITTQYGWQGNNQAATPYTLKDINDAIVSICDWYFIETIEPPTTGIVNLYNIDTVFPDGTHPTVAVMALMAKNMTGRISYK